MPRLTGPLMDVDTTADTAAVLGDHELILAERHAALRGAMSDLPRGCRQLITLLTADPPVPYAEISAKLGTPIGSIGPSRSRCLARLRRHPAIAGLIDADDRPMEREGAS
jgi:DNA-directed RNA polymerase specialized sigma24 family protein